MRFFRDDELSDQDFKLRLYDATNIDIIYQAPHDIQEYRCYELATEWYLPISETERDYVVELGYKNENDYWIALTRSTHTRSKSITTSRADTKSSNLESKEGTVNSYIKVIPLNPK
ncbi:MAG: DUF4912 domain-containing protein [Leptolyngbyaceae cyanobacterium]